VSARRTAARRDKNEAEIIDALRGVGCTVQQLSDRGVPDLLVARHGVNYLMEVKAPRGKVNDDQQAWHEQWDAPVYVVRNYLEALKVVGAA
jgi:hypothetical protein